MSAELDRLREQQYNTIMTMIKEHGYAIVDFEIDLATAIIDGRISKNILTLPVKLSLDKWRPYNYDLAIVDDYDHDHMPAWCKHLNYPMIPPADFESNTDWEEHGDDPEYEGEWYCYVYLYTRQPSVRPNTGIYLSVVDDRLYLYELLDNNSYNCYVQDADGKKLYHNINFRYCSNLRYKHYKNVCKRSIWLKMMFDALILLPPVLVVAVVNDNDNNDKGRDKDKDNKLH